MRKIKTVIIGCGNISGLNERDAKRIKPATHIGAIKKNCPKKFYSCRKKQRQALLQWAYNPFF